jgi:Tol biopolymer transport system component
MNLFENIQSLTFLSEQELIEIEGGAKQKPVGILQWVGYYAHATSDAIGELLTSPEWGKAVEAASYF